MESPPRDTGPLDPRRLREDELLRRYCEHRDRGELDRAGELWQQLAVRSHDRVVGLVKAFHYPDGRRLAKEDVEDAAQEAYLRVVAMGRSFREREVGQFRAALRRCVEHACLDFGRKTVRHELGSLDERYDGDGDASPYDDAIARHSLDRQAAAADAEEDEARRREQRRLVAWAISRVPNPNYRAVLELTYLERLSGEQIARRLGITPDNVYARRSRGQRQLEAILRDHRA